MASNGMVAVWVNTTVATAPWLNAASAHDPTITTCRGSRSATTPPKSVNTTRVSDRAPTTQFQRHGVVHGPAPGQLLRGGGQVARRRLVDRMVVAVPLGHTATDAFLAGQHDRPGRVQLAQVIAGVGVVHTQFAGDLSG